MKEYNERLLKNVLQDIREENDDELLKEIEEAKNNPLFANKEGEAAAFAREHTRKPKKKNRNILLKIAAILIVILLAVPFIPVDVQGRRSTIGEIIANFVNSEFLAFDSNEEDSLLLSYEGEFVPTFIPEGYSVESINNGKKTKEIIFSCNDNIIVFREQDIDVKMNVDFADTENLQEIEILGYKAMTFSIDGSNKIVITTENKHIYISCDDNNVDLIGFAEKLEKR